MKTIAYVASALLSLPMTATLAADKPDDYAIRFTVQTQPNASLQRLTLPTEALAALQTASATDVRLFNGQGQPVPMAQIPLRRITVAAEPRAWPIYPIMATTQPQQKMGSLNLRIEKTAGRSIVRVIEGSDPHLVTSAAQHIATLVDTRPLKGPLAELTVDAQLPEGEPVALTLTASKDLKHWRTLAQDVPVFRFGAVSAAPGSMRIPLSGVSLEDEYLQISWPPGSAFNLRSVSITPAASAVPTQRRSVPLIAQPDAKGFVITLPFATPLQALDIRPADSNTLVPVRLLGRSARGEPWHPLTTGVVYRMHANGAESHAPPIELNAISVRELRIEPATETTGFASAPQVSALINPQEWVFIASGPPPFTLAAGRPGADSPRLSLASLIPGYTEGAEQQLPTARVDMASLNRQPPSEFTRISQALGAPSPRSLVLWIILIGGVLVLGGVAWAVMRQMNATNRPQS